MLRNCIFNTKVEMRLVTLMLGLTMLIASCSSDTVIIGDYKLYDLDGSNQDITGAAGMVSVSDVTAYNLEGNRIYFETGVLDAPIAKGDHNRYDRCKYGFIETTKNAVVYANLGSVLQREIVRKLEAGRNGVVSRSCVSSG